MFNIVETLVTIVGTTFLTLFVLLLYIRRAIPTILEDVGKDIGEQFSDAVGTIGTQLTEAFTKPNVKRAMSILGKQSGEVRLNRAVERDVATAVLDQYPEAKMLLDRFAPDLLEKYGAEQLLPLIEKYGKYLPNFLNRAGSATRSSEKFGKY